MRQVADFPPAPGKVELGAGQFVVRPFQETLENPELIEDFHRRWVDGVATEIAEEIGVLFEHLHIATAAGEQKPRHHARWPAPDDDQIELRHGLCSLKSRD